MFEICSINCHSWLTLKLVYTSGWYAAKWLKGASVEQSTPSFTPSLYRLNGSFVPGVLQDLTLLEDEMSCLRVLKNVCAALRV